MHNPLALIALIAYTFAAFRILTYRRDGARYRHHAAWFAWLLLVVLGGSTFDLSIKLSLTEGVIVDTDQAGAHTITHIDEPVPEWTLDTLFAGNG